LRLKKSGPVIPEQRFVSAPRIRFFLIGEKKVEALG